MKTLGSLAMITCVSVMSALASLDLSLALRKSSREIPAIRKIEASGGGKWAQHIRSAPTKEPRTAEFVVSRRNLVWRWRLSKRQARISTWAIARWDRRLFSALVLGPR